MPAHSPSDGDLIFAAATGGEGAAAPETLAAICEAGAHCVARAIARGVHAARPAQGDILPTWSLLNGSA